MRERMRKTGWVLTVVVMLGLGCTELAKLGDAGPVGTDLGGGEVESADSVVFPDIAGAEVGTDAVLDYGQAKDQGPPEPECAAGDGCFLDKCQDNPDCQAGWCVDHMGESVCSKFCNEDCPAGWSCKMVASTALDVVYICVSNHATLCRPCNATLDCAGTAGEEDVCVSYGSEGAFCGSKCGEESGQECPWGFSCKQAVTVEGLEVQQCVADSGTCPCTQKSVDLALWTGCQLENEWGSCQGKRVCTKGGLTDCNAADAVMEACNGEDDDCDGDVDEPPLFEGEYSNICDDDNGCTQDACKGADGCVHTEVTGGECMDMDPCTAGDHCDSGQCVGNPIVCDDGNPCTDDSCDGLGGCVFTENTAECDDNDPCTVADQCKAGACAGVSISCDCQTDEDCEALDDGNLCNGTLACQTDMLPYRCGVEPGTEVVCAEPEGVDAICLQALCVPETGECLMQPYHEGLACEDGDGCTIGESCQAGVCSGGVAQNCNDGNPCTDDSCEPEGGCVSTNNSSQCDDGDTCTTGDQCSQGTCTGNGTLLCDDDNPCTQDQCQQKVGCVHTPVDEQCDDGNSCTQDDHCFGGKCVGTLAVDCDDGNQCTLDSCTPAGGCLNTDADIPCSDGNPCTLNDQCVNGACVAGPEVVCNDENACTTDSCGSAGLCLFEPVPGPCSDENECTTGDHCQAGVCMSTGLDDCDDGKVCTTDTCSPGAGCIHQLNQAPCDDGDLCTTGDHCHLGECIAGGALACEDGNDCTSDSCQPAVGCVHLPNSDPCDDGSLCTTGDKCMGGWCGSTGLLNCDDQDVCTNDTCDPESGCQHAFNAAPCSDGDACTSGEMCSQGVCTGGAPVNCNDGNECTDDSCDPDQGCVYQHNQVVCNDGDVCTTEDACQDGVCSGTGELTCDDGNLCSADSCDAKTGCVFLAEGSACHDENECTVDLCNPGTGECAYAFAEDGTVCDDGKECTEPDLCQAGQCVGAGPAICPHDIYVDINSAQEVEDGSLWYPWKSIAMGLADAKPGDNVWVFPGTYEETLAMPSGVKLRSLAGAAQTFIRRNGSGGIVLIDCKGCSEETLIEGFLLEAGTGNGQSYCVQLWDASSPVIRNNVMLAHHWQAYAIVISGAESKPKIINNTIKGWDGGADTVSIVISSGYPTVKNNIFIGDAVSGNKNSLGIDANNGYFPELNSHNYYHKMTKATDGCQVGEGGIFDNGNPPLFVDEDNLDYHLAPGSPGIDMGDPDAAYNDPDGSRNDMGAFGGPHVVAVYDPPVPSEPYPDPLPPDTVYVDVTNETGVEDGTPEHPFNTIVEGITWAGPGDTVRVASGVYNEVVKMKSGIKLIGENPANTVIDGKGLGEEFWSENPTILVWVSENSTLAGFRLLNSDYYGVYCKNITGVEMRNMIVAGIPHTGFRFDTCEATLINNTFVNCGYAAITAGNMNNTSVEMNNIFANGGSIYEVPPQSSYNTYFATSYYNGGGVGDITLDPMFMDAANGDYRLMPGSPAIDAGNPDPAYNDADGTRNDMGAFGGPKL